jgi:hypothetical protein
MEGRQFIQNDRNTTSLHQWDQLLSPSFPPSPCFFFCLVLFTFSVISKWQFILLDEMIRHTRVASDIMYLTALSTRSLKK